MRIAAPDDWNVTSNVHDWVLSGAKDVSVRVRPAARGWMEIDLRKAVIDPGARESAGLLNVQVVSHNGALEVTLPACLLIGNSQVELDWIDAYRQ